MSDRAAQSLGRRGGKAGTGDSKRRGDAAHYRDLAARSAETRRVRWESKGEWSHVTIRAAATGWLVDVDSRTQGERTGVRYLMPYATSGLDREADLSVAINGHGTDRGQWILRMCSDGMPDVKTLRRGSPVR